MAMRQTREGRNKAKLKKLRAAVQEGIDDINRGDYTTLRSEQETENFLSRIFDEARRDAAAKEWNS